MTTRLSWLALVLALFLIAGCADQPPRPAPTEPEPTPVIEPAQRALQLLERAEQHGAPERERLQLEAVELLLGEEELSVAEQWLQRLADRDLPLQQRGHLLQLQAQLLAARDRPKQALEVLGSPALQRIQDRLDPQRQLALSRLRAELLSLSERHLAAARERISFHPALPPAAQGDNQDAIWHALMHLRVEELRAALQRQPEGELRGWLELALIGRSMHLGLDEQEEQIDEWQRRWDKHPARTRLPGELSLIRELAAQQPSEVALLLPLSGQLAAFGRAVRDGFLAAWYESSAAGGHTPRVLIYDTAGDEEILTLYQRAVEAGAGAIIGPLDKQRVSLLHQQTALPVPTLALNRSDLEQPAPENFFQFGLAPEDEARQVALAAWQRRQRRALVLAPTGDTNSRILDAFLQEWETLGGTVADVNLYSGQRDFSETVRQALQIHLSEQRARELSQVIGHSVEFTPRRRQDVDMVFLLARAPQARSLRPLLDFHYAGDIPVYGISRIYDGTPSPGTDRDLEGMLFADMPWLINPSGGLRAKIEATAPRPGFQRLHALGVDSFRLYPRLAQLAALPGGRFYGETGQLTLNERREVERELIIAQFSRGVPRMRHAPETIDMEASAHGRAIARPQAQSPPL